MKPQYLIGVDLGTSATKAAIYKTDGTLVVVAGMEIPLYYPKPGVVEQENDDFYNSAAQMVKRCLRESGIDPRQVAAIAFDSQMAGIGSVDEDFRPATRFDSWLDMRCQPYIEQMQQHGDLVTRLTGCAPTCDHGPKILWWKNERPEEYARIAKFVTPAGYVAGKMVGLRGEQAFMDYTFIHFSGLVDAVAGKWSPELADLFGVSLDKLPEIVEPWRLVGEISAQAAADFGLAQGTPVAAGAGDTAAAALGAGVVRPGMLLDVAGTAAVLAGCTDQHVADVKHRALLTMRSIIPSLWNPLAYIAGGGLALRWFRDQFYNTNRGIKLVLDEDLYEQMTALANEAPPGCNGLYFSPHLGGRICPSDSAMRGAWIGFSWGHTQAHFLRSILEGVAFEYAYYLTILKEQIPDLRLLEAHAVGGGARSKVWNQIKADVLGVTYRRLERDELGTWGSAMIAGKAAGVYDDLASIALEAARVAPEAFGPQPEQVGLYTPLVKKYVHIENMLGDTFKYLSLED